jgi:hypothetical protein
MIEAVSIRTSKSIKRSTVCFGLFFFYKPNQALVFRWAVTLCRVKTQKMAQESVRSYSPIALLPYSHYVLYSHSPLLAPSDLHLFGLLKQNLESRRWLLVNGCECKSPISTAT